MSYDEPYNDIDCLINVCEQVLNDRKKSLYEIKKLNNSEEFNKENLISETQIHGVLISSNITGSKVDEGTESKTITIRILVPIKMSYECESDILRLVKELNENKIDIGDEISIFIKDFVIAENYKLSKAINGTEYELYTLSAYITTTMSFLMACDESVTIDGVVFKGILGIAYQVNKTTDGSVTLGDARQKEDVNGIQEALSIDFQFYKHDDLHVRLCKEAHDAVVYDVIYNNGYEDEELKMQITSFTKTSIRGDNSKGKVVFALASEN